MIQISCQLPGSASLDGPRSSCTGRGLETQKPLLPLKESDKATARCASLLGWGALVLLLSTLPLVSQAQTSTADRDSNGLIEIDSLLMLHNMRYNLAGTSYKTSTNSVGDSSGCPDSGCRGYELAGNLDFDVDGGGTWSRNEDGSYILHGGADSNDDYFPVDDDGAGGWRPIGDLNNPFAAVFDGNGHTISHLAIRLGASAVGLFGAIGVGAAIRNLGLVDNLADYTGKSRGFRYIGGLVGRSEGSITASYATGDADGGDGDNDRVGGLVGLLRRMGSITASYATGAVDGGKGHFDQVGGLVGRQEAAPITASYATGVVDGGKGRGADAVGGLVGALSGGSITASYATGATDGSGGDRDTVGGLVGYQEGGSSITASYATGAADGGDGRFDAVGGLVGELSGGSITASYGFGEVRGETRGVDGSAKPEGVMGCRAADRRQCRRGLGQRRQQHLERLGFWHR